MPVRAPLSVVVNDGDTERHVTRFASGLKFRRTAPGGDVSLEVNLDLPRNFFSDLGGGDRIRVDNPGGRTIWQGFTDNPGRVDGSGGQGYEINAFGLQTIANDRRQVLLYRDTDLGAFEEFAASKITRSQVSSTDDPNAVIADDGLLTQLSSGQAVATDSEARGEYRRILNAGLEVGAVGVSLKSGKTDSNYRTEVTYGGTGGAGSSAINANISTTVNAASRYVGESGHFPAGTNRIGLRLRRSAGATNVADDNTWTWWHNVGVLMRRMTRDGTLVTGASGMVTAGYVRADWVVEDLLGRMLPQVDRGSAIVEVPAVPVQIDQLAFPDGATAGEVLDHLMEHETGYFWTLGPGSRAGLSFAWQAWPTTARYEISTADGFDQPGGDFELCNRVSVVWSDAKGRTRTTVVFAASSPAATIGGVGGFAIGAAATVFSPALSSLEDAGRLKDAETVELPDGRGSAANALRIGQAVLTAAANPPDSATAVVRRPIVDLTRGGRALPWEVEPGCNVRVRETGQLIRLTETEYDDDEGSVTLTLGKPQPDTEQIINALPQVGRRVA